MFPYYRLHHMCQRSDFNKSSFAMSTFLINFLFGTPDAVSEYQIRFSACQFRHTLPHHTPQHHESAISSKKATQICRWQLVAWLGFRVVRTKECKVHQLQSSQLFRIPRMCLIRSSQYIDYCGETFVWTTTSKSISTIMLKNHLKPI